MASICVNSLHIHIYDILYTHTEQHLTTTIHVRFEKLSRHTLDRNECFDRFSLISLELSGEYELDHTLFSLPA